MFSSIWGGIRNLASGVYNTVNSVGSSIVNAFGGGGNQSANALTAPYIPGSYTGQGYNQTPSYATPAPRTSSNTYGPSQPAVQGPQLPVQINAGQQRPASGGSSSSSSGGNSNQYGGTGSVSYGPVAPTTLSARSLGMGSASIGSQVSTGGGAQPLSLGSAPTSTNPGGLDTTKLAGNMAGYYTRNTDGTYTQVKDDQASRDKQIAQETANLYNDVLGKKPTVAEDPEVIAARQQRQRIQQSLLAPTAELNAVIAKQNQDLLQLRQTGSQEGVTEAVYGGQSNAINYNAVIRALPLQASISSLQGDLKLAQDYLTELTQIKQEQINNQYDYNKNLFAAIEGKIDKKDQRAYEELKTANERAYTDHSTLVKTQGALLQNAVAQKAPQSIINAINNAKDINGAVIAAGQYGSSPDTQITQLDNGKTVVVDKKTGRIVADIGGQNPTATYNVAGLTPEQASDPFIKKLAATAGGKPITDAFAQKLNKGLTVLDQIGGLQANIANVKTGPIVGLFKGANPWDTNAQVIKAQLNAIVPNLARGVFGEVGVLTDNDIAQYSKTLPNLKSTEDIRNAVLGITVDLIGKSIKQTLEVNAANQKDVSGFIDIYTEMQRTRDSIFSQIPGYKGNGGSSASGNIDYTKTLNSIFN
jgi:hypothetical protein